MQEDTSFHGFARYGFALPDDGATCTLVAPHTPAAGGPWIWRARFFGHEPALDLALLERGFHLAYCDVANLYGSPRSLERWSRFHALLVEAGLSDSPVIEGMSRGGLPAFLWASEHPQQIALVIGDNPVLDFRTWPGGRGGKRSNADWTRLKQSYGLNEAEAWAYAGMPLDRLAPLANAGVPLCFVVGTADEVVPADLNAEIAIRRYRELLGTVDPSSIAAPSHSDLANELLDVWRKPGLGHHPHGLEPVEPLVRSALRATGRLLEPTTRAVPSAEHRGHPAGWNGDTWWQQLEKLRSSVAPEEELDIAFLGDSITQGLTGSTHRRATADGSRAIDRAFGQHRVISLGLSGDRTEHLLYRIQHGALSRCRARVVVVQIGVNNVNSAKHTGKEAAAGIAAVVRLLQQRQPNAHVLVCGPFPCGATPDDPRRVEIDAIHRRLPELESDRVTVLDLRSVFLDDSGQPNDRMRGDALHISESGQHAWMAALAPVIEPLLR